MAYELPVVRDVSWYGDPRRHGAKCEICPLKDSRFVPYEPPKGKLRLALVGEGPGRRELIQRVPFVGQTGHILNDEIASVGLSRDEMHITNSAMCLGSTDEDNIRASECCAPRLLKELAALPPDVPIAVLGKAATRSVLGVKAIFLARGFVWTARDLTDPITAAEGALRKAERLGKKIVDAKLRLQTLKARQLLAGRTILPMLHPTFAFIHSETWAPIFRIDFDRAARWVRGELTAEMLADRITRVNSITALKRTKRSFVVTDNVSDIDRVSKILGREVAVDIETERLKPLSPMLARILTVQISDGVRGIVIAPWDKRVHAEVVTRFLKGRMAILHNGFCFDTVAMERDGVSFEGVQLEDTLSAHHAFASHYPQKLDHVVSTFCDSSPWKVRFGVRGAEEKGVAPTHTDESELYEYGGVDAHVTKLAWDAMQKDLESERLVYEHDKRRAVLYKSLQVVGYPVDRRRRNLLAKKLKLRASALKGRMRTIARRPNFAPTRLQDVRHVLFEVLGAPMLNPTPTGLAGTSNATLEALRADEGSRVARFSEGLLNWRATLKSLNTYILPVPIHADGRAHYNFKPFGVITGRPASRILSAPRWSRSLPERVREIYRSEPGRSLVYFDLAQAEARYAANLSDDANFIAAVAKDIHTRNALILFPDAKEALERDPKGKTCSRHSEKGHASAACNCGRPFRDVTKNAGFAILYQAHPSKVLAYLRAQGFPVELDQVENMFTAMRDAYRDYDQYVKDNVRFVEQNGFLRTAGVGRIIWFGFHPKPTDVSNCLDDETEALTSEGWVHGPDLQPGQKLLTKNITTGRLVWEPIARMTRLPAYSGKLYQFQSNTFNAISTPEHRWLVRDRRQGLDRCATSEELAAGQGHLSIHRTGVYPGSAAKIYTDDFVELAGWLLTDGSIRDSAIAVFQTKRHNVRRIDAMFERLGVKVHRKIRAHRNVMWMVFNGSPITGAVRRLFPKRTLSAEFLRELTSTQLQLLLDTMMRGDGSVTGSHRGKFCCRDKNRADAFQMLCTLCGIATTARQHGPSQPKKQYTTIANRPKSSGCWIVSLLHRNTAQIICHHKCYGKHKKRVDHVSQISPRPVWCPTVRNTYFVARRKGDVYITGNSPIQSGIADEIDTRLLNDIVPNLPRGTPSVRGAQMIIHHYDSATFDTANEEVEELTALLDACWKKPVRLEQSIVCRKACEFMLPAETKVARRWSSL